MDYDKLIEDLRWWAAYCGQPCGCLTSRCILDNAAIAIETLRAENRRLNELICSIPTTPDSGRTISQYDKEMSMCAYLDDLEAENKSIRADLARVTAERDAAVKDLNEFLAMDELCPIQCEWCKWKDTFCDGKTPEWHGIKED